MRLIVPLVLAAALAACSTAPVTDSYCALKPEERIDFTDPGIPGLNAGNKRALLLGERTYKAKCVGTGAATGAKSSAAAALRDG